MKLIKYKSSVIKEGIDICGIFDSASDIFAPGGEFKIAKGGEAPEITFSSYLHDKENRIFKVLHPDKTYLLITDVFYSIFSDLELVDDIGEDGVIWSKAELRRVIKLYENR